MIAGNQIARRALGVTWREAVAARARQTPGAAECVARFDALTSAGYGEAEAAYRALEAHDLLWTIDAPAPQSDASAGPHDVPEV